MALINTDAPSVAKAPVDGVVFIVSDANPDNLISMQRKSKVLNPVLVHIHCGDGFDVSKLINNILHNSTHLTHFSVVAMIHPSIPHRGAIDSNGCLYLERIPRAMMHPTSLCSSKKYRICLSSSHYSLRCDLETPIRG